MAYKKKNQGNKIINNENEKFRIKHKEFNNNQSQKYNNDNLSIKITKLVIDKIKLKLKYLPKK